MPGKTGLLLLALHGMGVPKPLRTRWSAEHRHLLPSSGMGWSHSAQQKRGLEATEVLTALMWEAWPVPQGSEPELGLHTKAFKMPKVPPSEKPKPLTR